MPGLILNILHWLPYLVLAIILWGVFYHYPHFIDEEIEAQLNKIIRIQTQFGSEIHTPDLYFKLPIFFIYACFFPMSISSEIGPCTWRAGRHPRGRCSNWKVEGVASRGTYIEACLW